MHFNWSFSSDIVAVKGLSTEAVRICNPVLPDLFIQPH